MLKKNLFGMMVITFFILAPQVLAGQEKGAIEPLIYGEYEKVQLLPTQVWLIQEKPVSDLERELLQVSYLRGLYDGLQLANAGWPSIYTVFNELAGMDLARLRFPAPSWLEGCSS